MHACFLYMSLSSQVDGGLQSQQCNQTLIEGGVISTLCQLMLMTCGALCIMIWVACLS